MLLVTFFATEDGRQYSSAIMNWTYRAKLVVCSDGYLLCRKAFGLFKPVARRLKHTASKRSRELWNQRQIKATVIDGEHCNEWMHLLVRNSSLSFQVIIFAAKLLILIMTLFTFDKRVGLNSLA